MAKKVIKLTESELGVVIKHALNEQLSEAEEAIYARIYHTTNQAQQNQLSGISSKNPRKNNMEIIKQGVSSDNDNEMALIKPFQTDYVFHCQNLRGTAALTVFYLKELKSLDTQKAILKGDIFFNDEQLYYGDIIVDMSSNNVVYKYRGRSPQYRLQIDPSKKALWNELICQLANSLKTRENLNIYKE